MRKFMIFICLIIISCGTLTPHNRENKLQYFEDLSGMKKEIIYDKANQWIAKTFNSANSVIQYQNKKAGKMICKGVGTFYETLAYRKFNFTLTIDIKDNKMRLTFENFSNALANTNINWSWNKVKITIGKIRDSLFVTLKRKADTNW
jgi:hypothetical protein